MNHRLACSISLRFDEPRFWRVTRTNRGHPLTVSVNRGEKKPARTPRICFPANAFVCCTFAHLVLDCGCAHGAPVTHQDQGRRDVLRWPLAAFTAPENLLFPTTSKGSEPKAYGSHRSMADAAGVSSPLMARGTGAVLQTLAGPKRAFNQFFWLTLRCPTPNQTTRTAPLLFNRRRASHRIPRRF